MTRSGATDPTSDPTSTASDVISSTQGASVGTSSEATQQTVGTSADTQETVGASEATQGSVRATSESSPSTTTEKIICPETICKVNGRGDACEFATTGWFDCEEVTNVLSCLCKIGYLDRICTVIGLEQLRDCDTLKELQDCALGIDASKVCKCDYNNFAGNSILKFRDSVSQALREGSFGGFPMDIVGSLMAGDQEKCLYRLPKSIAPKSPTPDYDPSVARWIDVDEAGTFLNMIKNLVAGAEEKFRSAWHYANCEGDLLPGHCLRFPSGCPRTSNISMPTKPNLPTKKPRQKKSTTMKKKPTFSRIGNSAGGRRELEILLAFSVLVCHERQNKVIQM